MMQTDEATRPTRTALGMGSCDTTAPTTMPTRAPQAVTLLLHLLISGRWPSRSFQRKPMHSSGATPAPAME